MKQFLTTMAGVFAGLILFLVGVPFLLIVIAAGATRPAPLPRCSSSRPTRPAPTRRAF